MRHKQEVNRIHCILLLLCLVCLEVRCTFAQEQQAKWGDRAGIVSFDRPFESIAGTDYIAPPTSIMDKTVLDWDPYQYIPTSGQPRRLPPVEPPESEPLGLGFESGMGPGTGPGDQGPISSYRVFGFPSVAVKGQAGNWRLIGQDLSLSGPIWGDSSNALTFMAGVQNRLINTDVILPDSHKPYPSTLWNTQVGLMYMRQLNCGRMIGGGVNLGSASDHPFASINEMEVSMSAMYRIPSREHNAWTFGVMYSPMSEIQFPIPMVSYSYNPSDQFHAEIGLPLTFVYKPTDRWTIEASYMLITTVHVKTSYKLTENLNVFAGYDWSNEAYRLRDRTKKNDRFFLYDQRVTVGLDMPVSSWLSAELVGGYAFDRYSFTGTQWDSTGTDRVNIDPGPFLSLSLSMRR